MEEHVETTNVPAHSSIFALLVCMWKVKTRVFVVVFCEWEMLSKSFKFLFIFLFLSPTFSSTTTKCKTFIWWVRGFEISSISPWNLYAWMRLRACMAILFGRTVNQYVKWRDGMQFYCCIYFSTITTLLFLFNAWRAVNSSRWNEPKMSIRFTRLSVNHRQCLFWFNEGVGKS